MVTWFEDTSCAKCKLCQQEFVNGTCYKKTSWSDRKYTWNLEDACSANASHIDAAAVKWCAGSDASAPCEGGLGSWQPATSNGLPSGCSEEKGDGGSGDFTVVPTALPTVVPTALPTPAVVPSALPTRLPTVVPTALPTTGASAVDQMSSSTCIGVSSATIYVGMLALLLLK